MCNTYKIVLFMDTDKKRVTVIISNDIYKDLKSIANVEARSITSLVTYIILKYIDEYRNKS